MASMVILAKVLRNAVIAAAVALMLAPVLLYLLLLLQGIGGGRWIGAWFDLLLVATGVFLAGVLAGYGTLVRETEKHRRLQGLCPGCGYDLRASSDRCSECGRPIGR